MFAIVSKVTKNQPSQYVLLVHPSVKKDCFVIFKMLEGKTVKQSALEAIEDNSASIIPITKEDNGKGISLLDFDRVDFFNLVIKELSKPAKVKELCFFLSSPSIKEAALLKVKEIAISGTTAEKYMDEFCTEHEKTLYSQFFWDIKSGIAKGKDSTAKQYVDSIDAKATIWWKQKKEILAGFEVVTPPADTDTVTVTTPAEPTPAEPTPAEPTPDEVTPPAEVVTPASRSNRRNNNNK